MRERQASMTAMGIALIRALESEKPEDERICYDPFARRMIPGVFYVLGQFFYRIGYTEMRAPGVTGFIVARERYIDDELRRRLREGAGQVVILGAGYDTRAYRLPELLAASAVFEVDHPATQKDKLAKLRAIQITIPKNVKFVAIDFKRQTLGECLAESGYDAGQKTCFIWQGVIYYLDPQSADGTFRFITTHSAPGSSVVFDYIYQSSLDQTRNHAEVRGMRRYKELTGEVLTFGIPEGTTQAFLEERGFQRVVNVDSTDLKTMYFGGASDRRKVTGGYAIATAEVL